MTTADLIGYYADLLIMQYATKAKARATVGAFVGAALQDQIISQVGTGFNFAADPVGPQPDSAVGAQLDDVASYRGAQRVYFGLVPNTFFQMPDATDTGTFDGFIDALVGPDPVSWIFLTAQDTDRPLYSLTDDQLYRLTQLRAAAQSSPTGLGDVDAILFRFFGTNVTLFDNLNMTLLYVDIESDTDQLFGIAAISHSLPRPAGVLAQAIRAEMTTNFFGLQDAETALDSAFVGFSDALTALTTGTFISAP